MTPILTAALVLAGTAVAATFFIYRFQLPRERRHAGRALFASMDWSDFTHLVLALLNARGYERGFGGGGTDGEYLLRYRGQDWLLSSRHSRAYAPGTTAIAEFSNHLRNRGLEGGILAIPQRFPRAAHALGRAYRVDLLDGASMWDEMQPLLSEEQHEAIDRPAHARLRLQLVVAWVLAAALAAAVYVTLKPARPAAAPEAEVPAASLEPATRESRLPPLPQEQLQQALEKEPPLQPAAASALTVEQRRHAIALAVAAQAHVTSASWVTESTLLVVTDSTEFDPRAAICPLLERDADLAASRLQIRLPPGSDIPVRFLQCRAY